MSQLLPWQAISILQNHYTQRDRSQFEQLLKAPQNQPQAAPMPQTTAPIPAVTPGTNLTLMPPAEISNAAPATPK